MSVFLNSMSDEITLGEKAKKSVKKLYFMFFFVFYLMSVNAIFSGFYLVCFGNAMDFGERKHPAFLLISRKQWLALPFMLFMVYLWNNPVRAYLKNPTHKLRTKVRNLVERVYFSTGVFFAVSFVLVSFFTGFRNNLPPGMFMNEALPALFFSFILQTGMMIIYMDNIIYQLPDLMENLYTKEELFRPRIGHSIPFYMKISVLISACAIVPLASIYVAVVREVPLALYQHNIKTFFGISIFMLILGMTFIFRGFQKPLNIIIDKMKKISEGNYDVKSRIYFSDEIGRIKHGFNQMLDGLKEREELYNTFGKYLSIEVARELVKNKKVKLGGEEMDAAVMFCDIRNFTPLSEKMGAAEVVKFLNDYFSYITPPITGNKGIISKFMGDGIMAVYTKALGAQAPVKEATASALEMREALKAFNASGKYNFKVNFGIGLHSGKLIAGNIGTPSRLEYTFIGDTVNVASRLEAKTKDFSCDIIASSDFAETCEKNYPGAVIFKPLGETQLKGKSARISVYSLP